MTALNENQQRSVLSACQDLERRIAEMEAMLDQADRSSAFSEYANDLSPTERRVLHDYFARLRAAMADGLRENEIPLDRRRISLRWALQCRLTGLQITVEEMGPSRLRGYGALGAAAADEALKLQQQLDRHIERISNYLRQGLGRDLGQRLRRLEAAAPHAVSLLALVNEIVTRHGLVEFRPALDALVQRMESPQFEIAVFGRVSSGKSSLLNHVIGADVLPVGVTPVTAVPTRVTWGEKPAATICFAEAAPITVGVERLAEFASEEQNPGNRKHVTAIAVGLPSPRLRRGIALVDTPGLGSLATAGGAETLAYLPRCDLGVVLIDAGSVVSQEDVDVVRLLYEAGIPAQVLVSKADLLSPSDCERTQSYIAARLREQLNIELPIHAVSTIGTAESLLVQWFEREIAPLWDRQRSLAEASLRRKTAHLAESVATVLQALLERGGSSDDGQGDADQAASVRRLLDEADHAMREAEQCWRRWSDDVPQFADDVLRQAAQAMVAANGHAARDDENPTIHALRQALIERGAEAFQVAAEHQQRLLRVLDRLGQAAPLSEADPAALREAQPVGLPMADANAIHGVASAASPWWAFALPSAARESLYRALRRRAGAAIRATVENHDRRLRDWLKRNVTQANELFESQAEVIRQQLRRAASSEDQAPTDTPQRETDLRQLRQALCANRHERDPAERPEPALTPAPPVAGRF